ncbi:unnamed protein product [Closterium sp. Naga37s-1]|nr:unnamed protein product [Closterium sp. Naga37s-1]
MSLGGRFKRPPPPPSPPAASSPEAPVPIKLSAKEKIEQKWLLAEANYKAKWRPLFPWLLLVRAKDGHPSLKCAICRAFGKETTKYSNPGDGARDLQTQTMRIHEHSTVHQEAVERQLEISEAVEGKQKRLDGFTRRDVEGRRVIRLMRTTNFICKVDAPISMYPRLVRFLAEQETPDLPQQSYGVYLTRVLGASIVLLAESKHKLYETVISYKFQFCLFFLADVLAIMNELNLKFQKKKVDVTEIAKDIDEATGDMRRCYLECEDIFGAGESPVLSEFLTLYGRGGGKKVRVRGVDTEGHPVSRVYKLHERHLKGHVYGSTYKECEKLCTKFAQECVTRLNFRLSDLRKLAPTKLFRASKWPKQRQQRDRKVREYLHGCSAIFGDKLPGFDMTAAERELQTWAPIMEAHHEDEGFFQGLRNFMNTTEASRRPAKAPVFAAAERKRKEKELYEDEVQEKEDRVCEWGEEQDSDQDGEEGFAGAGQEDASDNPFLSENEGDEADDGDDRIEMAVPEL